MESAQIIFGQLGVWQSSNDNWKHICSKMFISIKYVDINIYPLTMECGAPLSMFIWKGRNIKWHVPYSIIISIYWYIGMYRGTAFFKPFQGWGYFLPKHKDANKFLKPSKPCHVHIHRIALAEHSQMSTHMCQGFSHFSCFYFCINVAN